MKNVFGITKLAKPKGVRDLNISFNRTKILAMDIETMDYNGNQIPIAISLAFYKESPNQDLTYHFTLINKDLLLQNENEAIKENRDILIILKIKTKYEQI